MSYTEKTFIDKNWNPVDEKNAYAVVIEDIEIDDKGEPKILNHEIRVLKKKTHD